MAKQTRQERREAERAARKAQEKEKQVPVAEAMEKSLDVGLEAEILVGEEAYAKTPAPELPPVIPPTRVVEAYIAAAKAKTIYDAAKESLDSDTAHLNSAKDSVEAERKALEVDRSALQGQQDECGRRKTDLDEREEVVKKQEAEAINGFMALNAADREAWERQKADEDAKLKEQQQLVKDSERDFKRLKGKLALDQELLNEDREALQERIQQRAAALAAIDREERDIAQRRLESANARIDLLLKELDEHKAARWSGGGDLNVLAARHRDLEEQYNRLQESIANYPSLQEIERLRAQDQQIVSLQDQLAALVRDRDSINTRYTRMIQSAGELESLRDQKESAEAQLKIVRDELRKLKVQVEGEDNQHGSFPALAIIDQDSEYQTPPTSRKWPLTNGLSAFVSELQQGMKQEGFDYSLLDLRCFVAGMAMSRLHIIQGISGTGKTSLPRLFARCANSGMKSQGLKIVEVQAGWRDRQDLLGYYNAFEKTYRQTEFLRALYEAQTPRYRDTPYIIILDEMNLSRPEQYFADLLSALEADSFDEEIADKHLVLMDRPLDDAPGLFVDKRKIAIPENVWFMGTANHDETTLEFADKTYDRAHVLELPHEPTPVKVAEAPAPGRLSYNDLGNAFEKAIAKNSGDVEKAKTFFNNFVEKSLDHQFGIGIGNRLKKRQLGTFVPVFIAAGGSIGDALDHMLVTRVLRKTVGLHDTNGEQFRMLAKRLREGWGSVGFPGRPERTIKLMNNEVRIKEPGNSESVWQ